VVESVVEESLRDLADEVHEDTEYLRWELGACWVQHLQTQAAAEKADKKPPDAASKGNGNTVDNGATKRSATSKNAKHNKQHLAKEDHDATSSEVSTMPAEVNAAETPDPSEVDEDAELRGRISDAAFKRLKETETGLHSKVCLCPQLFL
jgi:protein TIF31